MGTIKFSGFVCDEDSGWVKQRFGKHARFVATLPEIGITLRKGTKDPAVFRHAREAGRIIVTSNGRDFRQLMQKAAAMCTVDRCLEGAGLVIVPNQVTVFPYARISRGLKLGDYSITWDDVFICNLLVETHADRTFRVTRLPLCDIFRREHLDCERCVELGIITLDDQVRLAPGHTLS